jgi:hypothetical protein
VKSEVTSAEFGDPVGFEYLNEKFLAYVNIRNSESSQYEEVRRFRGKSDTTHRPVTGTDTPEDLGVLIDPKLHFHEHVHRKNVGTSSNCHLLLVYCCVQHSLGLTLVTPSRLTFYYAC